MEYPILFLDNLIIKTIRFKIHKELILLRITIIKIINYKLNKQFNKIIRTQDKQFNRIK